MKILYIASHCPFGESYGAQLRTLQIGRLLQRIGSVTMVLVSVAKWDKEILIQVGKEFDLKIVSQLEPDPISGVFNRFRHEFDPTYLNTHGWKVNKDDADIILQFANSHDVTWIHTLRVANLFNKWKWKNTVLDVDDIYSQYHNSSASQSSNLFQRLNSLRKSWLWSRRERNLLDRFDVITVCSDNDKKQLTNSERIHIVPNGFDDPIALEPVTQTHSIGVVGRLDYKPNGDGVDWFVKQVWPRVRNKLPHVEFNIIGYGANEQWKDIDGVNVLGYVDDTSIEIAQWSAMVVPLHIGAGTRVKIAEAFARNCPVISTTIGAFGYDVINDRELLLADEPEDFALACINLIESEEKQYYLAKNGREYFDLNLSWDALEPRVAAAINMVCDKATYNEDS